MSETEALLRRVARCGFGVEGTPEGFYLWVDDVRALGDDVFFGPFSAEDLSEFVGDLESSR